MPDLLETLVGDAFSSIQEGYYVIKRSPSPKKNKLAQAISACKDNAIISEVKFSSPSLGAINKSSDHIGIAESMVKGGAVALSVLTEPKHFAGSIKYLEEIVQKTEVPVLMKDIFVSPEQVKAASLVGADAIVLISSIFRRGMTEISLESMIREAHKFGLEVLLECHDLEEFTRGLKSKADLIGINNRDLGTMQVSLEVSHKILSSVKGDLDKIVVVESGLHDSADVNALRMLGAKAFLVGTSIMSSGNIEEKVAQMVKQHD
ncbi:MAG: indole-3-glycerol-phosphate synthase [Nitrososphaerales archaeon]